MCICICQLIILLYISYLYMPNHALTHHCRVIYTGTSSDYVRYTGFECDQPFAVFTYSRLLQTRPFYIAPNLGKRNDFMFAYYRSSSFSTATQLLLRGSVLNPQSSDLILVKVCKGSPQLDLAIITLLNTLGKLFRMDVYQ